MHVLIMECVFGVSINKPDRYLLVCLRSKRMFGLVVDINFNISGSSTYKGIFIFTLKTTRHITLVYSVCIQTGAENV